MVNLFVILTYLMHGELSSYLFPVSIFSAIGVNFLFASQIKLNKRLLLIATCCSLLFIIISLSVAWFYFDLSWDGQWYHQAAVYNLVEKWNPILKPLVTSDNINNSSILYFPKNSWFFGAAIMRLFGTVEMGKAFNLIALFAAFGVVYSLCRDFKLTAWKSVFFTTLVVLNPVVWCEIISYLNDGDLYLFLVIYLASVISWLRDPKPIYISICVMATICLVNIKFTGLVFFMIAALFLFIYILIKERSRIKTYVFTHALSIVISVCIFGFNPYVTNMLNRGNPLYPIMGSKHYPSVFANGSDDNESYETPKNMMGKSLPIRLMYANFGRPGNAPYNGEDIAQLANPVLTSYKSWKAYNYQETRVSGFGPYFGLLLVLTFLIIPILVIKDKSFRLPALVFFGGLCCCLFISKHFWWPRLFPMFWLIPLLSLFQVWTNHSEDSLIRKDNRWLKTANILGLMLAVIIGINGLIVAFVHMRWETLSSVKLRMQLKHLSNQKRPIEVDYGWFKRSMEGKLTHWNIKFTPSPLKSTDTGIRAITSVVEGYPNQVLYRLK